MVFPSWRTRRNPRGGFRRAPFWKPDGCRPRGDAAAKPAPQADQVEDGETQDDADEPESLAFEIFVTRRFRGAVEAMSAARNALDRVKSVDEHGVPDHLPD